MAVTLYSAYGGAVTIIRLVNLRLLQNARLGALSRS
jgi:hypothetical protein